MSPPLPYRNCPACGFDRDPASFERPLDLPWRQPTTRKRRNALCFGCRQRKAFETAYASQWDWAAAVNKTVTMKVAHRSPFDGVWGNITPHTIRVLDMLQGGKCAVTGMTLVKPEGGLRTTLTNTKLTADETGRLPVLVRIGKDRAWDTGNVILIASIVEDLYRFCGSLAAYRGLASVQHTCNVTIPAKDVLDGTSEDTLKKEFDVWRRINAERIQSKLGD